MPNDRLGRYYDAAESRADAAVASAARTATGTGTAFDTEGATSIIGSLNVTAAAGTSPTLDLTLETTADGGTTWYTAASFPQQTGTTATPVARVCGPVGSKCRWKWTIGGTSPSFTFTVTTSAPR